jgi:hypothetical protein
MPSSEVIDDSTLNLLRERPWTSFLVDGTGDGAPAVMFLEANTELDASRSCARNSGNGQFILELTCPGVFTTGRVAESIFSSSLYFLVGMASRTQMVEWGVIVPPGTVVHGGPTISTEW